MKTFLQYLAEAGIRRKQRVAAATERASWKLGIAPISPYVSGRERSAAIRTAQTAETDVKQEQARRVPRIVRRAKAEAEAHVPPYVSPEAKIERMGDVGSLATEYGKEMLRVEKPSFVRARVHGNDGY